MNISFAEEITAIKLAIQLKYEIKLISIFQLFSDSSSTLESFKNISFNRPCRQEILLLLYRVSKMVVDIQFLWVQAHVDVKENVVVELLARNGIKTNPIHPTIP